MKYVMMVSGSLLAASGAAAAPVFVTHTNENDFLAATGSGLDFDDFNSHPTDGSHPNVQLDGVVDVEFRAGQQGVGFIPAGFWSSPSLTSTSLFGFAPNALLIADFESGVTAVAANVISLTNNGAMDSIRFLVRTDSGYETSFIIPPSVGGTFFGLTVEGESIVLMGWQPVGNLSISYAGIDDFYWGVPSGASMGGTLVPLPSAALMGMAGLSAAGLRRRR